MIKNILYIKDVSNRFASNENNYFRVAVRDFNDNNLLIKVLKNNYSALQITKILLYKHKKKIQYLKKTIIFLNLKYL